MRATPRRRVTCAALGCAHPTEHLPLECTHDLPSVFLL